MADFDKEMWQDFVVEVQENLEEFEPNLLLLEQQPGDQSILNDCFRNMHSIKGAANYMGFSKMGELAHKIENLMDMARQGEAPLTQQSFDVIFQAVDWFRKFLEDIEKNHKETLDVSALFEELDALKDGKSKVAGDPGAVEEPEQGAAETEEDDELLTIFQEEMKSLYSQLASVCNASEVSRQTVVSLLEDMERVTNYMGHEGLLSVISALKEKECPDSVSTLDEEAKERILKDIKAAFKDEVGLELEEEPSVTSSEGMEIEEDKELYTIFLDFFREVGLPLAKIPEDFDQQWAQDCQDAIERLKTSANYMDYMEVVRILEEWEERLAEVLSSTDSYKAETFRTICHQLTGTLPGLPEIFKSFEDQEYHKEAEGESGAEDNPVIDPGSLDVIDSAIDNLIIDAEDETGGLSGQTSVAQDLNETTEPSQEADFEVSDQGKTVFPQAQKTPETAGVRGSASSRTVRVNLEKVEHLLEDVAELVVLRSSLQKDKTDLENLYSVCANERMLPTAQLRQLKEILLGVSEKVSALERVVNQLQDGVMRIRMLPVSHLFGRFPRMVRDISRKVHKDVELVISGADTALDKQIMEQLADPLQHIIRNAVDHGIETPEERKRHGKPQKGTLSLSASQEGNFVVITVSDDGKGLDRDAIIKKASSLGLIPPEKISSLTESQIHQLIFAPGFSTAETVSDLSGRGVGLDVVKKNIERIGGTVMVRSVKGKGTTILLRIPLTLAIVRGLIVKVGDQSMVIPVSNVFETFRISSKDISQIEGYEIISRRQETLPLIRLSSIFRGTGARKDNEKFFAVRVRAGELEACLGVDALVGQQEVVIKPLSDYLMDQPGFAGATILGDGSIALILDLGAVVEKSKGFIFKRQQILEQQALGSGVGAENVLH